MDHDEALDGFRSSIDNIDAALVHLLAERFKVTKAVGRYKAAAGLPPADPARELIGDDEIGWTDDAISNFEDGCYAKLIDLDKDAEPVIAAALSMPCTVIENVPPLPGKAMEETDPQDLDLTDNSITENTRFA